MAEYLGEGRSPLRGGRPSRTRVDFRSRHDAPSANPSRDRKPEDRRDNNLKRFLKDFKGGISALGSAIDRLLQYRRMSGGTKLIEKRDVIEREKIRNIMVPHVLERELLTGRQAAVAAPFRDQPKQLLVDYRENTRKVVAEGIPQFLAAMLRSEATLPVQHDAMRPARGNAVEALMKVAKSVKAGRLPFVPKETRRRAQELLDAIYSKRTGRPSQWRDKEIAQTIERHRLIPLAAQTQPSRAAQYQNFTQSAASMPIVPARDVELIVPARDVDLKESDARRLESVMPRLRDEGVAAGPKIIDAGESTMHTDSNTVVYRDNSSHVASPEQPMEPSKAAIRPASAAVAEYRSPLPSTRAAAAAPTTPEHKPPRDIQMDASSTTSGGLGSRTGGGTVGASGTMKIDGRLEIPALREELGNWIARVEGQLRNG